MHPLIRHEEDPDHPGWWTWELGGETRFNSVLGPLLTRADGPGRGRCLMHPEVAHSNLGGVMHGGALLTFIDMAMFAGGHMAGVDITNAVTLDMATQFLAPAGIGKPVEVTVEVLRETRRLVFMRGLVEQDGAPRVAWSGTLRKGAMAR